MTLLPSYLNVHLPFDPPILSSPLLLLLLFDTHSQEIAISILMTGMKLLKLITGLNTSFSVLIRKLIAERLVAFSLIHTCPLKCGLIKTDRGE